jgi:IS30 family transposase
MRVKPYLVIRAFKKSMSATEASRELGIHRTTVWRWVKKTRALYRGRVVLSERGLYRKSTKPHTIHTTINRQEEFDIIQVREETGFAAIKIKGELKLETGVNTIHRLLSRKGLLNKYGNHIRPKYQETTHMHLSNTKTIGYLQMDVKYITPELSGLPYTCFEYAIIDIFSRYKEAVILNHLDQDGSIAALLEILPKLPFKPVFLQTDNGLEFQGRFRKFLSDLKIKNHYVHKSTPNENALIERTFRTDEEEFFFRMKQAPKNYDELRIMFAEWLYRYNYKRIHLGINLKTPYEIVANVLGD